MSVRITSGDIARDRGWTLEHASRWLRGMAAEHPEIVIQRGARGRSLVVDAEKLAALTRPDLELVVRQLANRVRLLESAVKDQDLRINGVSRDLTLVKRESKAVSRGRYDFDIVVNAEPMKRR